MKKIILVLFVVSFSILSSCHRSVDSKAEKLFTDFMEFMNESCGSEIDIKNYKIIYTAPNDSLAVIEFESVEGEPKAREKYYFTYVVDDTEDNNYWVSARNNPVEQAKEFIRSTDKIFNKDGKPCNISDADIYPAVKLSASGARYSGNAMTEKDSYNMIKALQK